jgi:RND family efflux transporter MFP subunit
MNRRRIFWIVGPLILLFTNFVRDSWRLQERYEWERVEAKTLNRGVFNPGVMEAFRVAEIKSEVDEIVVKKMVEDGQAVKVGQPLLQLSQTRTKLEYEQKRNALLSAQADVRKTARDVGVQKKLLRNLAVSRQQVDDAGQSFEKAKASLSIAAQEFDIVQKKLASTLVRSPLDGMVLKDYTKVGSAVSTGKELITVGDISKFVVRSKIDELDIQSVKIGQTVQITADAFAGQVMQGSVKSIASQAEREAFAKVEVITDITDAQSLQLKHNLSVRINIVTEQIPNALSVPIKSVIKKDGDTAWVMVRNSLKLIGKRKIKIGKTAGDRVQVLSGLTEGNEVGTESTAVEFPQ